MKMDKIYDKVMDYLWKALVYIVKNLFKFTFNQVLSTFKTTLRFKKILNTRTKQMIYCLSIIITCLFIWVYKLHPVLYFISPFSFFSCYGFIQDLKKHRERTRIKLLNNKYKKLREMYDNKIDVLSVKKDFITIFSNELTEKDISSKHSRLELFFNRKIAEIRQQEKNLRYIDIYFLTKTKFSSKYYLEQYIEYADIKKKNLPFILGVDEKENIYVEDLSKLNHVFISGESDMGKSVLLNCIIQSLLVFSNNLEMILVDLKEGIEMYDYSKFPNCLIISNMTELYKIIEYLEKEMIKRLNQIKLAPGCKNILQYNNQNASAKMHFIVVVVDEFATIKINNGEGKALENSILSLLQKGRAAGIYLIGATQRPSGQQINTDVRAGFLWNISLRVKTPETQRMTKIYGTEGLKVGEFKTDIVKDTTLKSLFIDENTHNGVFENLEHKLVHKKEFIQIKEKDFSQLSFYKRLCLYIDIKLYKRRTVKCTMPIDYVRFIKLPSESIMTEIESIKKAYGIGKNNPDIDIFEKTDGFNKYLNYLFVNSKDGFLPNSKELESRLELSRFKRLKYQKRAMEEGHVIELSKSKFRLVDKEDENNEL